MIDTRDLSVRLTQLITADLDLAHAYDRIGRFRDAINAAQAVTIYLMVCEGATITGAADELHITRQHAHRLLAQYGLAPHARRGQEPPALWNYGALLAAVETIAHCHEQITAESSATDYWSVLRMAALTQCASAPTVWKKARQWIADIRANPRAAADSASLSEAAWLAMHHGIDKLGELPSDRRLTVAEYALVVAGYRDGQRAVAAEQNDQGTYQVYAGPVTATPAEA